MEDGKIRTIVISGFPGVGKSHLFNDRKGAVILDSDSSQFSWSAPGVRNPEFPANYIEHIKANMGTAHIILVSSHKAVRDALRVASIRYVLVYPARSLKAEYVLRYVERGSDYAFVKMLAGKWDTFLDEIEAEWYPTKRELKGGEFLSDVLGEYFWPVMCSGACCSDSDDYCGMHMNNEPCPACEAIRHSGGEAQGCQH